MTQEEILDYNNRCAEFLGYKNTTPDDKDFNIYENEKGMIIGNKIYIRLETMSMRFHSDWNWIHEVVEAIEKLADWTLECLNYHDGSRNYQMMIPLSGTNIINNDKKEAVVQAINQFLIWYNNEQTN